MRVRRDDVSDTLRTLGFITCCPARVDVVGAALVAIARARCFRQLVNRWERHEKATTALDDNLCIGSSTWSAAGHMHRGSPKLKAPVPTRCARRFEMAGSLLAASVRAAVSVARSVLSPQRSSPLGSMGRWRQTWRC